MNRLTETDCRDDRRDIGRHDGRRDDRGGHAQRGTSEDGSLVTEYGLLVVVAATVAGVVIQWATNGALVRLFNALLSQARALVGA